MIDKKAIVQSELEESLNTAKLEAELDFFRQAKRWTRVAPHRINVTIANWVKFGTS